MADWNDPQTWADAYGKRGGRPNVQDVVLPTGAGYGEDLTYLDGRKYALQLSTDGEVGLAHFRFRLQKLGASGAFTPSAETLVVGCGFGWLVETIVDVGSNAVWGTDTSTAIQNLLDDPGVAVRSDVRPLIFDINILDANAAQQFKAVGAGNNAGKFRNVVTDRLIEDWPISEIDTLLDACDALLAPGQSRVFHIVLATDGFISGPEGLPDPAFVSNQLSLAEWVALRPSHYWIDDRTGAVGGGQ